MTKQGRQTQTVIVGAAGACAVFFFELAKKVLGIDSTSHGVGHWIVLLLSTLSVYTLSFHFGDWLHRRYLWRMGSPINLNGSWTLALTNVRDNSTRTGEVYFLQDRDSVSVKGTNHKPGTGSFSTWSSRQTVLTDESIFILYEIETSQDPGKTFKRGVIRLQLPFSNDLPLVGDFYDNAPSEDRGPIKLTRRERSTKLEHG